MKRLGPLEEAEELRQMEMHRLDDLQFTAAPLLASSKADETKCAGIDRTLKVMERRAKLCGLDAAEKYQREQPDRGASGRTDPGAMGRGGTAKDPRKEEWWRLEVGHRHHPPLPGGRRP